MTRSLFLFAASFALSLAGCHPTSPSSPCRAGNINTTVEAVDCPAGYECPPGNPDIQAFCEPSPGQAGDLCRKGNIMSSETVVACGPGTVCPLGNPDVSAHCVVSQ